MFVTETQLFELKFNKNSKYYGKCLAEIFLKKFDEFSDKVDFFKIIRTFYHAFSADETQCFIKFGDNSILLVEQNEAGQWKLFKIYHPDYLYLFSEFEQC